MTSQRDLDRLLDEYFVLGTNELPDRVIDGALAVIERTPQRRPMRVPARIQSLPMLARLAAAALIAALAFGGGVYLLQRGQPAVGGPSHSPSIVKSASWTATGSMTRSRLQQTATLLLDGRVLVVGGLSPATSTFTVELYDPIAGTWTATGGMIEDLRYSHTATLLRNGTVLVAGGYTPAVIAGVASAELYDPATGTWTATGSMTVARAGQTATLLADGRVLVAGGGNGTSTLASAELYDPATGTWTATGSMTVARSGDTATLLPDGRVLVAGGMGGAELASAELYDPATGTWTATGSMTVARSGDTATLLPDGRVLVAGGMGGAELASAELYDPATGTWTATASMTTPRVFATATLLRDGRVLVAGGESGSTLLGGIVVASAELYDPDTGAWTATAGMAEVRESFTATLLADGNVLVAGGDGGASPQPPHRARASAELYDPGSP